MDDQGGGVRSIGKQGADRWELEELKSWIVLHFWGFGPVRHIPLSPLAQENPGSLSGEAILQADRACHLPGPLGGETGLGECSDLAAEKLGIEAD